MVQLSLALAEDARDKGIAKVMQTDEFIAIYAALQAAALHHAEITPDEVWQELGDRPVLHRNALGAAFRHAAFENVIRGTGIYRKSNRVEARGRVSQVWASLIFRN